MNCQQFKTMSDSYIGDELLVETNHDVLRHLENCAACRGELAATRELRMKVRHAVKNDPKAQLNAVFARRLEANLRQTALRPTLWEKFKAGTFIGSPVWAATIAACLLLGVLFGGFWLKSSPAPPEIAVRQEQTNQAAEITPPDNSRPAETDSAQIVKAAWREMTSAAVGDHENCALHFRLKETPIPLAQAAVKFGKFNKDLDKTVMAALQNAGSAGKQTGFPKGQYTIHDAHSCVFEGRRFTHIILENGEKMISVLVAETELSDQKGSAINSQSEENFQTASFLAARHAVFVVSNLSERENMSRRAGNRARRPPSHRANGSVNQAKIG